MITAFLLSFLAGPALFWLLARQRPGGAYFIALCIASLLLIAAAFGVNMFAPPNPATELLVLIMIWLGWIMVLVLCTLAVRARTPGGPTPRIAFALGAIGTTLPWFGLYSAVMMGR